MSKKRNKSKKQLPNVRKVTRNNAMQVAHQIVPKSASQLKVDIRTWVRSKQMILNVDYPKSYFYYNLVDNILEDTHLSSQLDIRMSRVVASDFSVKFASGDTDDDTTKNLHDSTFFTDILEEVWRTIPMGDTLLELDLKDDKYVYELIPRQNVLTSKGIILKDYTEDTGIKYKEVSEYGVWLLDFGKPKDIGFINKAIPQVIYKRFAQACWSELCEICGIPPRVLKTNTSNLQSLRKAEQMMRDMASAAWFIIDDTETLEWANPGNITSNIYENLIKICDNQISMLVNGAIVGADTKYGNRSKEEASQDIGKIFVEADKRRVQSYINDKLFPALYKIGFLPSDDLRFEFDKAENIDKLWERTKDILPYKEVDDQWIKSKFGIEVTGDKANNTTANKLAIQKDYDFFD